MKRASLFSLLVFTFLPVILRAQVVTGTPPFGTFGGGPDVINLANLNSQLTIPVVNKAGRGTNFTYNLVYNSAVWMPVYSGSTTSWSPNFPNWGWGAGTPVGYLTDSEIIVQGQCTGQNGRQGKTTTTEYFWTYHDGNGAHLFPGWSGYYSNGCTSQHQQYNLTNDETTDGSDYKITVDDATFESLYGPNGASLDPPIGNTSGSSEDRNGNEISQTAAGVFTDTLGTTALTIGGAIPAVTYSYTAPSGGTAKYTVNYTYYTVATNFGVSGIGEFAATAEYLVSSIVLPDGSEYTFKYEATPSTPSSGACTPISGTYSTNCVTARLTSVTLPTGGTISYAYSGGNNGILSDGTTATLTRTTPDSGSNNWTYAHSESSGGWTTTVTDPQGNQTVYTFEDGIYLTQQQVYQGSSTLLQTVFVCYNGAVPPNCNSSFTFPFTSQTTYIQWPSGVESETVVDYSNSLPYEEDDYDYGSGSPGNPLRKTLTSYASLGNILNEPASVTIENGSGTIISKTSYTYDQGTLTSLSGTPQLASVSGSRGNATTISHFVSSSENLSKAFTYYNTGNVDTATDVNGSQSTVTYNYSNATATCGNAFPSSVSEPLSLSRSMTWNCTGGVETSVTDENSNTVSAAYSDPDFWRPASTTDQESNQTNFNYGSNSFEQYMIFNNNTSITDALTQLDGLGRPLNRQRQQQPGGNSNFDTTTLGYDSVGRSSLTTVPCVGAIWVHCPNSPGTTQTYDALSRQLVTTDGGLGTVTLSYAGNDILQTIGPAPTGENTKRRQSEYNGIGQLTSVCEVTSLSGSGTCGQTTAATGYWTKYTYDVLGDLLNVTQNAQSSSTQSRSYAYDGLGRILSETNPETGTINYVYDTDSTCGTSDGDLVKRTDAAGNVTCYAYDALHRKTSVTYPSGPNSGNTPGKFFVYDSSTVDGNAMGNAKSRLAEAYTATCSTCSKITDEGFSYTMRGEVATEYESTPHSGGYYTASATYWANGVINGLTGTTGYVTNYSVDGEGRVYSASAGSDQLQSTTYNAASEPLIVTFGSGDSDSFTYDPNTFRMTQYKYTIGATPQSLVGNLTWNANSSLGSLAITDPFNSTNTQTCTYRHDDLARIASANCGSSMSQTFTYDAFGNITKNGTFSFQPGYNNKNQMISGATYDSNGDVLTDSLHSYAWDVETRPTTVDTVTATYDALGRMVEQGKSGSYTQIQYSPTGFKMQLLSNQTFVKGWTPMPGGTAEVWQASGASPYYLHADWLGSSRFASTFSRTMYNDLAYAPFGEQYAQSGSTGITDTSFAGNNEDTTTNLYDAANREYEIYGRWPSPDPARMAAANPANPQSWNRYAYAMNSPLNLTDATGLQSAPMDPAMSCHEANEGPCMWGNGGGVGAVCIIDGVEQPCSLGTSGADVECPGDVCSGTDANGTWAQFYAFVGGVSGYYNPTEFANGINVVDGQLLDDANYNAYLQQQYANQIAGQCARLSAGLSADFGDTVTASCNDPSIAGGHANFTLNCGNGPCPTVGRYDDGVHIECASGGYGCAPGDPLVVHDDTISPWTGSFSFSAIFTSAFWEHGFVDLMYGSVCNCVFPH